MIAPKYDLTQPMCVDCWLAAGMPRRDRALEPRAMEECCMCLRGLKPGTTIMARAPHPKYPSVLAGGGRDTWIPF